MNGRTWLQPNKKDPQTVDDFAALSLANLEAVADIAGRAGQSAMPRADMMVFIATAQVYATLALAAATDALTEPEARVHVQVEHPQ